MRVSGASPSRAPCTSRLTKRDEDSTLPSAAVRTLSTPSPYSGGRKRLKGICAAPQRGRRLLLQVPSWVRYLSAAGMQGGGSRTGHSPSSAVRRSEILCACDCRASSSMCWKLQDHRVTLNYNCIYTWSTLILVLILGRRHGCAQALASSAVHNRRRLLFMELKSWSCKRVRHDARDPPTN